MMDRHATTGELLALRDGEGGEWTREHAAACAECTAELFRLEQVRAKLKALPTFAPPRDRWSEIKVRARRERRSRWVRGASGIAAAVLLTGLTFVALQPKPVVQASEQAALDRAMARSQALEQTLKAIGSDRQVLGSDAAGVVAELEDRLSRIDARLNQPSVWNGRGAAADLWQERAGVLGALVDVRTTRATYAGL